MSQVWSPAAGAPVVAGLRWPAALTDLHEAWHAVRGRHWAAAISVAGTLGLAYALQRYAKSMQFGSPYHVSDALEVMASHLIGAVLMMFGWALLDRRERRTGPEGTSYVVLIIVVAAALTVFHRAAGPLINECMRGVDFQPAASIVLVRPASSQETVQAPWLYALGDALANAIALVLGTVCYLHLRSARRTAEGLASAQLRRVEIERRTLAEQLASAQATVDPAFLFDTLQRIDELFERDRSTAQRLLTSLIAYLRAALPPLELGGSTVGQQLELLRAYLEIETIRFEGRLVSHIDVPPELAERPFAPLLLLPLATNAVRHGIEPCGRGEVIVRVHSTDGTLAVEVSASGSGQAGAVPDGEGVARVRERLVSLYGVGARLTLSELTPSGVMARLEVPEVAAA